MTIEEFCNRVYAGESLTKIAKEVGITRGRARQIMEMNKNE